MPDLPRGTVAFLFTDIEGSTLLWERDREVMAASVRRHLVLVRAAIESHNGVLFKVVGDAVQAAFPTASDSVGAAISSQRAIAVEPWPDEVGTLRVRMALHAGEATPDDRDDYLSPALNRLARLLAVGHGGQILLTDAVCRLLDGQLPDRVTLRDLGRHELRDLQEPEQVWQAIVPDLPDRFPPLKSFVRRPTNLPTQPNPLVGREAEVAELTALITRPGVPLVTLTGPGGTGKTRLALQAAADALEAFPDGVFFVDLGPVIDPALVIPTIAAVLGVRAAGSQPVGEALAAWLAPRRLLLVLDNLEHLLPAAKAIAVLLATCPSLTMLATSREPLHLRSEREMPVAPLALPEEGITRAADLARIPAVALFVQRAEAANPRFALTEANAADVAAICQRLDGLPLAIELAAARIKLLPPPALLARLERRLPLLTGGPRDLPERQRTLRDAIGWSHDLLSPEEQVLFRRLGAFAGGWTLDTAETVANRDGELDVLGGLDSLVNKSLVRSGDPDELEPRFGMLETVREFALEQLAASGEEAPIRDAHAAAFFGLAEQCHREIRGPRQIALLRQLEAELPNVRAALAWLLQANRANNALRMAGDLGGFWYMHSHFAEGRHWVEAALAASDPEEPSRARALWCLGFCDWVQGDPGRARELLADSERLARVVGDTDTEVMAAAVSGSVAKYGDDDAAAETACLHAVEVARAAGNLHWVGNSIMNLAEVAYRRGDLSLAEERARESLAMFRSLGSIFPRHYTLSTLGYVALDRGQTAAALTAFAEGLTVAMALNEGRGIASLLAAHAAVAVVVGEHDRALHLLGAAEAVREKAGHTVLLHQFRHARTITAVREAVGDTAFATGFAAGRALQLAEALAEASAVGREAGLQPA